MPKIYKNTKNYFCFSSYSLLWQVAADNSKVMLFLVGLGLSDVKDITVKGLEIVRACKRVYLEAYTSILGAGKDELVSK